MLTTTTRETRGKEIFEKGTEIQRIDERQYRVASQSGNGYYQVTKIDSYRWKCSCPDYSNRFQKCKHIYGVEFSLTIRDTVQAEAKITRIENVNTSACRYCGSSNIVKNGIRHNLSAKIQIYYCEDCSRKFSFNIGFEKMRASPQIITSCLQLYFSGESLRNVQKFLRLQGVNVSHVAVYKWITKYVRLMEKYLEQIKPKVSDVWRADELYLKFSGNMKYLFAMMDDETRFWIAQEVGDSKTKYDARQFFAKSEQAVGKKPMTLVTDGLKAYQEAYRYQWRTLAKPRTKHVRNITFKGEHNNNKMERLNGEIRDREKVMRSLKKENTPIIPGYQIYHNYVRPHMALNGKTPAEAAGISIEGENKWLTLIQNASRKKTDSVGI